MIEDSSLKAVAPAGSDKESIYRVPIEHLLKEPLEKQLLSGIIVGIFHQGQWEQFPVGSGLSESALVELGSVSKIFTGLLLAVMIDRGMIGFDEPIHSYLSSALTAKIGERPIRVRDLALHRAGLPSRAANTGRMKRHIQDPHYHCTVDDLMEELSHHDLQRPEMQQYSYSNLGYTLLGYVLEKAGHAPFSTLMKTLVFDPLGLSNTCIEVPSEREREIPQGYTQAGRKAMRWYPCVFTPSGGVCSTMNDCMRLLELFLNPSGPLQAAVERMLRPSLAPGEGKVLTWKQRPEEEWCWHNGVTGGFTSYLSFHPERQMGLVLLTNRYAISLVTELGQRIQSTLMGEAPAPMSGQYETAKAYVAQGLIEFVESPIWLRAGLAGLATGIFSWFLR